MSIASRIQAIEQHLEDDYSVLELAGADLTNVDKNIVNLKPTWQERLLYFINNGTEEVYDNWEKVTGEGTSLTLNNTLEAKMKIVLKGNTYQYSTSGKNLLNIPDGTQESNGITFVAQNGEITINGTANGTAFYQGTINIPITAEKYSWSANNPVANSGVTIRFNGNAGNVMSKDLVSINTTNTTNFTSTNTFGYFVIRVESGTTLTNFKIKPQLEKGEPTSYEPYTNGPAPNPDFPMPVQVVSGDNSIKVEGKNLWKLNSSYTNGTSSTSWILPDTELKLPAGTYTLSYVLSSGASANFNYKYADGNNHLTSLSNATKKTLTFTEEVKYVGLQMSGNSSISNLQIEKGEVSSPNYEPYTGASYPINLPEGMELCKIGTYQDKIDKSTGKNLFDKSTITSGYRLDNSGGIAVSENEFTTDYIEVEVGATYIRNYGSVSAYTRTCFYDENKTFISNDDTSQSFTIPNNVKYIRFSEYLSRLDTLQFEKGTTITPYEPYGTSWYLKKEIGKVVLNGTENWRIWAASLTNVERFYVDIDGCNLEYALCEQFRFMNGNQDEEHYRYSTASGINKQFVVYVNKDRLSELSISGIKTWVSNNNIEIYYALITPTYTLIEGELLNQLEAIKTSYEGQTNLSQTNNNLASVLNASALQEM